MGCGVVDMGGMGLYWMALDGLWEGWGGVWWRWIEYLWSPTRMGERVMG